MIERKQDYQCEATICGSAISNHLGRKLMQQFLIPDMTCKHCEAMINAAVKEADAHADVKVDLANHLVSIVSNLDAATLEVTIREAGYSPTSV
jgi:copper chaperone